MYNNTQYVPRYTIIYGVYQGSTVVWYAVRTTAAGTRYRVGRNRSKAMLQAQYAPYIEDKGVLLQRMEHN
jgi:hypothetical protein